MKLYEIANEYQQAFDAMSDEGLSHEIIADSLAAIGAEFEEKAKVVAAYVINLDAEALAIKDAYHKMKNRHEKILKKIESLEKYLLTNMKACETKKISTSEFAVSIRKNPPKLILDEEKLSSEWFEEKIIKELIVKKETIRSLLKIDPEGIPGAYLQQSEHLHFE